MRNMLAFLAVVALTAGGVGWYLGWFQVSSVPGGEGQRTFTVDVHTNKISQDLHQVEARVEKKLAEKAKQQVVGGSTAATPAVTARNVRGHSSGATPPPVAGSSVELPGVEIPTIQIDR